MDKAYKFRLYPNNAQASLIQRTFGCCRFTYNHFLSERIRLYQEDKSTLNFFACCAALTVLKAELPWLREADASALQTSLRDLDAAYQNFFRRVKRGDEPGFPRYKNKKNNRKAYRTNFTKKNIEVFNRQVKLPKLGLVECRVSCPVEGRILNATISQSPSGKYFVSFCCTDVDIPQYESTGAAVGVDLGLKNIAVTSDGIAYANHRYLRESEKKLARLQRQLSRKPKGSRNREKARIKVARQYERVANQRNDTLHKLTTSLIKEYDVLMLESLHPQNMLQNKRLAKSISDASWGEFVRQIEYKAAWRHKAFVKVASFFPSSQSCNVCGFRNTNTKDLGVRAWLCPECGVRHNRDQNAAKNILNEGLRLLNATTVGHTGSYARGEHVRRNAATLAEPGISRL